MTSKLIVLFLTFLSLSYAQQPSPVTTLAKCIIPFTINSTSASSATGRYQPSQTGYDNRQTGCTNWSVVYTSTGYSVISLRFESAPSLSNTPPGTPGTYVAYAGTTASGINPNTAITSAASTFSGYTPWIRLAANTLTGTGRIVGVLIGTLPISSSGGSASTGSPCPGTVGTPCVVVGPTDTGNPATTAPVQVSGVDPVSGAVTPFLLTLLGKQIVVSSASSAADGQANIAFMAQENSPGGDVPLGVANWNFRGASWDKSFVCANQATLTITDATRTQLIALSGLTTIRVCHIHVTTTAPETITISRGTGSACGTGTAVIDSYLATQSLAMDFQPTAALRTAAGDALCVTQSAVQNLVVTVVYAQF